LWADVAVLFPIHWGEGSRPRWDAAVGGASAGGCEKRISVRCARSVSHPAVVRLDCNWTCVILLMRCLSPLDVSCILLSVCELVDVAMKRESRGGSVSGSEPENGLEGT